MDNQQSHQQDQYNYDQYDQYNEDDYNDYNDYNQGNDYDNDYYMQQQNPLQYKYSDKQYEVLPYNALFAEVGKQLKTTKEMTALDQGWCLLLLRQFKWDVQRLAEYFQNMQVYRDKIGYRPQYKNPNQVVSFKGQCEVCCTQNTLLYQNICLHSFCTQCWKNHLETSIRSTNPFIKCMGCQCPVLYQTILSFLHILYPQTRRLLDSYQKQISQQFSTIHRNYQFCTGVDCGNCIKVYNLNLKSVKCTCGKVFCFKCNSDDHSPCTCEEKKMWQENVLKEEADAKWMAVHAKLCPWCKKAVQRSAGCNFMACVCGKSFCYLCSRPWQPDHKDHFKCHIYKKSTNQQVNRQKQILEKMNFYTQRFLDNQATAVNNKKIDTFRQRKLLFQVLKIDLSDSEFIDSAYKFSVECCECLKWIYAYSYYTKWKNEIDEQVFKFHQGQFEKYKVNLLKMLAVDLKNFLTAVQKYYEDKKFSPQKEQKFVEQFRQLKKTIVNYFTMTKKYKEKFINEIQNRSEDFAMGLSKKKSSGNPTPLQRKKTDQKKEKKEKKQTVPTKMVTRSSGQKQKQIEQSQGGLKQWLKKPFS